ncbi:hypothetical protein [Sessilibacter corallicola]|uniref:hypothetical protein n=1 Tax=Sessilibacter corallicola TaxID=2904075 RepID=UPI001E509A38|nr:hypothetical protein [Sessilibacter corallicola]
MIYEIRVESVVIGTTKLEGGDPPMGFVFGSVTPTEKYKPLSGVVKAGLYQQGQDIGIKCKSISFEDLTKEMGETCIEITVFIESAEEYDIYFKRHREVYENQFS